MFTATPNGVAMQHARALLKGKARLIDLAADFRLQDAAAWEKWYGMPHACPELLAEAVYGLPEVNREKIRKARLVANPGCYPTAVQLGFLPLLEAGLVDAAHLIADAKSGVSGAGRKAEVDTLFSETSDNFKAYAVPGHRHWPEIREGLDAAAGKGVGLTFVPHLTPMIRGIHATLYAQLVKTDTDLQALYEKRYANEPFVDVLPPGSHPGHAFGARVECLPHRRASPARRRHGGGVVGDRQSGQGRRRSGGAEHEHHVRSGRAHRADAAGGVALEALPPDNRRCPVPGRRYNRAA